MKKLFNSKFLIILASSLIVLIILIIGAFYLFDDKDSVFVKSGYVLNPLSSTSEKYYFDENVGYRENLSSMIEFTDVDDKTVSVLKDSFVHYLDESISLLKNGAILDLDSVKGNNTAVTFYNITNESIIEKKDNRYVISSSAGDIKFDNFIARISDNKYIVVGDLTLKMVGNDKDVKGDYFEVVYVEEGILNIENKDVKYQVAADGTSILVDGKVIDLGSKIIKLNNEDIMSITAITIDGDENIEIIPKGNDDDETDGSNGTGGEGNGNGTGNGSGNGSAGNGNNQGNDEDNGGDNQGGTGNSGLKDKTKETIVSLKEFKIDSVNIDVTFDIVNARSNDQFVLQVLNLSSGRIVNINGREEYPVTADALIPVTNLTPGTKYLFMVVNKSENNTKYFQKVLETSGFGVKVEKAYATFSSLVFDVIIEENTDITDLSISLEKFNESTGVYEDIPEQKKGLADLKDGKVFFEGLDSDTIYTVVLNDFKLKSTGDRIVDLYKMSVTALTLKERPDFSNVDFVINSDDKNNNYQLYLDGIVDDDNAIVNYKYKVYKYNDDDDTGDKFMVLPGSEMTKNAPFNIKVGNGEGELPSGADGSRYYGKVVVEYFDNEKYLDYETIVKDLPILGVEAYVTVETESVDYNSFKAKIKLKDAGCLIYGPGKEGKCQGVSSTYVLVRKINKATNQPYSIEEEEPIIYSYIEEGFRKDADGEYYIPLDVDNLEPGETYYVEVEACRGTLSCVERRKIEATDDQLSRIKTKSLAQIKVQWGNDKYAYDSNETSVLNVPIKLVEVKTDDEDVMNVEDTINLIKRVEINLYEGAFKKIEDFNNSKPENDVPYTMNGDINANLHKKEFVVDTLDTFGATKAYLESKSEDGEKLSLEYTILVKAFMDEEGIVPFNLATSFMTFEINPQLIGGEVLTELLHKSIHYSDIKSKEFFDKELFGDFTGYDTDGAPNPAVGYQLDGKFDVTSIEAMGYEPSSINFYVYGDKSKKNVKFYVLNNDGELEFRDDAVYSIPVFKESSSFGSIYSFENIQIYMTKGNDYALGTYGDTMSRGNLYSIGYEIIAVDKETGNKKIVIDTPLTSDGNGDDDKATPGYPYVESPNGKGVYKSVSEGKIAPDVNMYVTKSTADSITYKYSIIDADNAVYKDPNKGYSFYYMINNSATELTTELVRDKNDSRKFSGDFTISGLQRGNFYSYYLKRNKFNTGVITRDVSNYIANDVAETRIFDGIYDFSKEEDANIFNFKYEIVSDLKDDNRLIIKILAHDGNVINSDVLDRIVSYKLILTPERGDAKIIELGDKEIGGLTTCPGDDPEKSEARCIVLDYLNIKEMKSSDENNINNIYVKLIAYYDNGLTGYDFTVGDGKDYKYMIMQNNSSSVSTGEYIGFSSNGKEIVTGSRLIEKGYHTHTLRPNGDGGSWSYRKFMFDKVNQVDKIEHKTTVNVGLKALGYKYNDLFLNPKMVSDAEMNCVPNGFDTDCNKFSFLSITPEVSVKAKSSLLDGAVYEMKLSNAVLEDIRPEGTDKNRYIYAYVWDKTPGIVAGERKANGEFVYKPVKEVKIPINTDGDPNGIAFKATIDGLMEKTNIGTEGHYSLGVYVWIKKSDGYSLEQMADINDVNDQPKIYDFVSASPDYFFSGVSVSGGNDKTYGIRELTTKVTLAKNRNINFENLQVEFDFDLVYLLCDTANQTDCSPDSNSDKIKIPQIPVDGKELESLGKELVFSKTHDVTESFNNGSLVYDKSYYMYVYAKVKNDVVDNGKDFRYVLLNQSSRDALATLNGLGKPHFNVTREATIDFVDDVAQYGFNFEIEPVDSDKVLQNGVFKVKLVDEKGNKVGKLNGVEDYLSLTFDATSSYKNDSKNALVFTDIEPDKKYNLVVYNDIYLNNASIPVDERISEYSKGYEAYSANKYGLALGVVSMELGQTSMAIGLVYGSRYNQSIMTVDYQIKKLGANNFIAKGSYAVPDDREFIKEWDEENKTYQYKFTVDLDKKLVSDSDKGYYNVRVEFKLRDPLTGEPIDSSEYSVLWKDHLVTYGIE